MKNLLFGLLLISLFLSGCVSTDQARKQPNIIFFVVDDLGWQDTSVAFHSQRTEFNDRYKTPALQQLANTGMRFTNAYASAPVCTPTRTSIMTGMSPGRSHITYWTLAKDSDTSSKHPTLSPPDWNMNGIAEGEITLPGLLRDAGYRTIHVGKAHFSSKGTGADDPRKLGFDINIAGHASGAPASYYGTDNFARQTGTADAKKSVWDVPGLEAYHGQDIYLTEALSIEANKAIIEAHEAGLPFFINFAPYAVHTPIQANKALLGSYEGLDKRESAYATMIESVDNALASLLHTLHELGIEDDTIVIYTSDNGGLAAHSRGGPAHTQNAPLRSGKGSAYEGGLRVPTVVRWAGVTPSGAVSDTPIISHDFFTTILTMASVPIPSDHASKVEGIDLSPVLTGVQYDPDRALFWNQPHQWGANGPGIHPFTSIRRGEWKLIYFHAQQRFELYNLDVDIGETTNLASEHPERLDSMKRALQGWIVRSGAQLSIDKASGEQIPLPCETQTAD